MFFALSALQELSKCCTQALFQSPCYQDKPDWSNAQAPHPVTVSEINIPFFKFLLEKLRTIILNEPVFSMLLQISPTSKLPHSFQQRQMVPNHSRLLGSVSSLEVQAAAAAQACSTNRSGMVKEWTPLCTWDCLAPACQFLNNNWRCSEQHLNWAMAAIWLR